MAKLTTKQIKTFNEYVTEIENWTTSDRFWFRGVGKSSYELKPSILRNKRITKSDDVFEIESGLMTRFKERSIPYLKDRINDEWEWLFLMQHYGMPTRLLDWTENPFIALFFALSSAKRNNKGKYVDSASVWLLSPEKWNQFIFSHLSYTGSALSPTDTKLSAYLPGAAIGHMNENPVAIFGIHNSPRIVAQRGSFCLFGKSLNSMEKTFSKESFDDKTMCKIDIDPNSIEPILEQLTKMGISDSVVYPDLDGLAKEIKRTFNYEV